MRRGHALALLLAFAAPARAQGPDGGATFRMEPKAAIDDLFGDAGDYRRIVDHFLALDEGMQKQREDFARAVQATLGELQSAGGKRPRRCPEAVATSYPRALILAQQYLASGRELTRYYEQIRELDRFGETLGLTPDYRSKVKRVGAQYGALLTDYREMKIAFHDQLTAELRFGGCDPLRLSERAQLKLEAWPSPGEPGAPGSPSVSSVAAARPPIQVTPPTRTDLPLEAMPPGRTGVLFYVDNSRCRVSTRVALDGRPLGEVPAATRTAFSAAPGGHDLCLIADTAAERRKKCGDPGTVRKSYLHEGWTIALRCE